MDIMKETTDELNSAVGVAVSKNREMSETELLAIVDGEINNSLGKMDTKLANARLQAMKYYMGEKEGNLAPPEAEGRSSVVSTDLSDTIEWILPSLIRIFTESEQAVEFAPRKPEDVAGAEQATDWANYVFWTQNEGFIILHDLLKDGLLQKLGVIKTWWNDSKDITTEEYEGLTLEELTIMLQDESVEVIQKTERPSDADADGKQENPLFPAQTLYDVKVKRTADASQICIENVPPEEFLVSRKARTPQRLFSCAHRLLRTVTELKEAGYSNTDQLMNDDSGAEFSQEAVERNRDTNEFTYGATQQSLDETMRFVWITESYLQVDWDGDGLAEWRKVVKSGKVLLSNEEIEEHPFSMFTPIKMPHKLVGRSVADLLMDLQEIKTALLRQTIDATFLANNPRMYVDENASVNIDDLLDNRIGGIVRGRGANAVTPLVMGGASPIAMELMAYIDQVKESRTGVNKTFQGLNADALNQNTTATATNAMLGAAQDKIELIARIFAETCMKDLFRKILKLSSKYQQQEKIIRLTGQKFVSIDPRAWKTGYDVTINVGLGSGNKDQIAAHIMNIMRVQQTAMQGGLPIVSAKEIYNAAKKLTAASGFKKSDSFFIDPDSDQGRELAQQASQKPNPDMLKVQGELQLKQAEMQINQQNAQAQNEVQRQNDERDFQRQQAQSQSEFQLRMAELEKQRETKLQEIQLKAQVEIEKHRMTLEHQATNPQFLAGSL